MLLACFLDVYYGKKIGIIDADEYQWSLNSIYQEEKNELFKNYSEEEIDKLLEDKKSANIDVHKMMVNEIVGFVSKVKKNSPYDFLFIDLGQRKIDETLYIFELADHIIVPYSKDAEEIKKSVIFSTSIKRNFPDKNIKSLVIKIFRNKADDFMEIRKNLKRRFDNDYYKSIILGRDRYPEKRSLIWPLNYSVEEKDFGKGVISFMNEFLEQF